MPLYPSKCCELGSASRLLPLPLSFTWTHIWILQGVVSASFTLFIPLLILPKTEVWVKLPIFCTLRAIWKEWKKRKCKEWNGRKGPTFIFGGPTELFLKIIVLFAKCNIGFWILIRVTCCTSSLDFKNLLLPKCGINWLMPFPCSFSLDILSMKRQKVLMDARKRILFSSNDFPSRTDSIERESTTRYSRSRIWPVLIDFVISTKSWI